MRLRDLLFGLLALAAFTLAAPSPAAAQDAFTVALFTPSLDFKDGVERNDYVSRVADELSSATGAEWRGKAFARRSDFEGELRKGNLDVVIVDGEYFAARGSGLTAVASLKASGDTARAMTVVVGNKGKRGSVAALRGAKIAVGGSGGKADDFLSGDLLGGELAATDFFAKVDEVKDARAAINAVDLGKADAALVFSGYGGSLAEVASTAKVPLPVVAIASDRLTGDLDRTTRRAARSLSASAGIVSGSGSYDADAVKAYLAATRRKRPRWKPAVEAPAELELELGRVDIPSRSEKLDVPPIAASLVVPDLESSP